MPRANRTARVHPTTTGAPERHTGDTPEPQLPDIKVPRLGEEIKRGDVQESIVNAGTALDTSYLDALKFMEEPVRIRIEPSQEENAPMTVDVFCNGKGAEVWNERTQRWMELNILPIGLPVTTKRKYVEILARSKQMKVQTPDHGDGKNIDNNNITRRHIRGHVFSVINDSAKGAEWLTRLQNEAL